MKNVFDGLFSRLDTTKERISEIEEISIETSKTEMQTERRMENTTEYPRTMGLLQKVQYMIMGIPEEKKDKKEQRNIQNADWEFPEIKDRHQT